MFPKGSIRYLSRREKIVVGITRRINNTLPPF